MHIAPLLFAPIVLAALALVTVPVEARRDDQSDARAQMLAGKVMSLRAIEAMVIPRMRDMQYLGPEFDPVGKVYRLKFIDKRKVVFVDVDATNGEVLSSR